MMEFAWVSYWFPNAGTGAFCEYLNAVYIGGNKQKQNELFMKERKFLQQGRVGSNEFSQEKKYKHRTTWKDLLIQQYKDASGDFSLWSLLENATFAGKLFYLESSQET